MADPNEVILKISADLADAVTAVKELTTTLGSLTDSLTEASKIAAESTLGDPEPIKQFGEAAKTAADQVINAFEGMIDPATDAATAISGMTDATADLEVSKVDAVGESVSEVGEKASEAEPKVKSLWETFISNLEPGGAAAQAWGDIIGKSFDKAEDGLKNLALSLPNMVTHAAKAGEQLQVMANRLGTTTTAIDKMQFIADQANIPLMTLSRSAQTLSEQLADSGSKATAKFKELGLSAEELRGKPEEALYSFVEAIKTTVPATEQAAAISEVFGRRGQQLTGLLHENITALKADADQLGLTAEETRKLAEEGDRYYDNLGRIQRAQEAFAGRIANVVLPVVNEITEAVGDHFTGAATEVVKVLYEAAEATLPLAAHLLVVTGNEKTGFKGLWETMKAGGKSIKTFIASLGEWAVGLFSTTAATEAATAANLTMGESMAATPWGAIAIAVIAVGVALYELYQHFDEVKKIVTAFAEVGWDLTKRILGGMWEGAKNLATGLGNLWDGISNGIHWIGTLSTNLLSLGNVWPQAFGPAVQEDIRKTGEEIKKTGDNTEHAGEQAKEARMWYAAFRLGWTALTTAVFQHQAAMHENEARTADAIEQKKEQLEFDELLRAAQEEGSSALEAMTARRIAADKAIRELDASTKALVDSNLKEGQSAKEIAEGLIRDNKSQGVSLDDLTKALDRYKKAQEDANSAAEKTPLAKFAKDAKELSQGLDEASKAGLPATAILDQFGKKAAELVETARQHKDWLEKLPPIVRELAAAWSAADLAPKMKAITDKAAEFAKTFDEKVSGAMAATTAAMKDRMDEMRISMMSAEDAALARIELRKQKELEALAATQAAEEQAYQAAITTARAAADEKIRLLDLSQAKDGEVRQAERDQAIATRDTTIDSENKKHNARLAQLMADRVLIDQFYDHEKERSTEAANDFEALMAKRGYVTAKVAKETLANERKILDMMEAHRAELGADADAEIAAQRARVEAAEKAAGEIHNVTVKEVQDRERIRKESVNRQLAEDVRLLAVMKEAHQETTQAYRDLEEKIRKESAETTDEVKLSWTGVVGAMADSFEQLANISGDTFGGIAKGMGQVFASAKLFAGKGDGKPTLLGQIFGGKDDMGNALTGMDKITNGMTKGAAAAANIAQGVGSFMKAMDQRSAGGRAVGGAMAGAQIGSVAGPWGMAVGAAAGFVAGLIKGKPAWAKAADEVARDFGVKISDELGKTIAERAKKEFRGDRFTATIASLPDILKEAGGVTDANAKQMTARLRDVFVVMGQGKMTADQARKTLDESFGAFAEHILKSGKIASKEFQDIISLNESSGLKSAEVAKFVADQTGRIGLGLKGMMSPLAKNLGDLADLQSQLGKETDQAKVVELTTKIDALKTKMGDTGESMARFERLAVAGFNAAIKGGAGYFEAMTQLGPALDTIVGANKALGRESSEAISELLRFREVAEAHKDVVESAAALGDVMLALSNIGGLTTETMADLQVQGVETFKQLKDAGFSDQQALQQMLPFLEEVRQAHTDLNLPIDENTQALIDQAEGTGVLKKQAKSMTDVMQQGFEALLDVLGGQYPKAWQKAQDAAEDSTMAMGKALDENVKQVVDDTSQALDETKWASYAAKGMTSAQITKNKIADLNKAVEGVDTGLDQTDWEGWADDAVEAARRAEEAIDGVTEGHSPGGIKEIPIKLTEAVHAFKEWERQSVGSAERVQDVIDTMTAGALAGGELAIRATGATASRVSADAGGPSLQFNITSNAIDGSSMRGAFEREIVPMVVDIVRRNTRGVRTDFKSALSIK